MVYLRQLLHCILWAYSLAAWLDINISLSYLLKAVRKCNERRRSICVYTSHGDGRAREAKERKTGADARTT